MLIAITKLNKLCTLGKCTIPSNVIPLYLTNLRYIMRQLSYIPRHFFLTLVYRASLVTSGDWLFCAVSVASKFNVSWTTTLEFILVVLLENAICVLASYIVINVVWRIYIVVVICLINSSTIEVYIYERLLTSEFTHIASVWLYCSWLIEQDQDQEAKGQLEPVSGIG